MIIDEVDFQGVIIVEGEDFFVSVQDLFFYLYYDGYYDSVSNNIIIEGQVIPLEFFRTDSNRNLYISMGKFCQMKEFTCLLKKTYQEVIIKIITNYQKTATDDFIFYIQQPASNSKIKKFTPSVFVNGSQNGGDFKLESNYYKITLSDGTEYRLYIKPDKVYMGEEFLCNYKIFEAARPKNNILEDYGSYKIVDAYTDRNFEITFYDPLRGGIRIELLFEVYEGKQNISTSPMNVPEGGPRFTPVPDFYPWICPTPNWKH